MPKPHSVEVEHYLNNKALYVTHEHVAHAPIMEVDSLAIAYTLLSSRDDIKSFTEHPATKLGSKPRSWRESGVSQAPVALRV